MSGKISLLLLGFLAILHLQETNALPEPIPFPYADWEESDEESIVEIEPKPRLRRSAGPHHEYGGGGGYYGGGGGGGYYGGGGGGYYGGGGGYGGGEYAMYGSRRYGFNP